MTVKESHDILNEKLNRMIDSMNDHNENHNADIKSLQKFKWTMIGGMTVVAVLLSVISIKVML